MMFMTCTDLSRPTIQQTQFKQKMSAKTFLLASILTISSSVWSVMARKFVFEWKRDDVSMYVCVCVCVWWDAAFVHDFQLMTWQI